MAIYKGYAKSMIEDIKSAIEDNHSDSFEDIVIGAFQVNELDYPCAHIIPDRSDYEGRSGYRTSVDINFYFERDPKDYSFLTNLGTVDDVKDDIMSKLDSNSNFSEYKLTTEEFLAGEVGQKMLNVYTLTFECTWLIEFADF